MKRILAATDGSEGAMSLGELTQSAAAFHRAGRIQLGGRQLSAPRRPAFVVHRVATLLPALDALEREEH